MTIAFTVGATVTAIVTVAMVIVLAVLMVRILRDWRAQSYTKREVARGAVEFYPPERLPHFETDVERALRETYEGKRPIRRVRR